MKNDGSRSFISNESFKKQINVLIAMSKGSISTGSPRAFRLKEISHLSGMEDERETQRYLFILEGQKLVSPQPAGDLTSGIWAITNNGLKAVKVIKTRRKGLVLKS